MVVGRKLLFPTAEQVLIQQYNEMSCTLTVMWLLLFALSQMC